MTALKKGFTLIELLIVIAILGVLAVVVLVAINPVQQLARTRDAGRISTVSQLGHSVEAWMASHNGTYPAPGSWTTELSTSGDLSVVPAEVNNQLNSGNICSVNEVNGWCYDSDQSSSFVVYTTLEADTNINYGSCTGNAYEAYLSLAGKGCIVCGAPAYDDDATSAGCQN